MPDTQSSHTSILNTPGSSGIASSGPLTPDDFMKQVTQQNSGAASSKLTPDEFMKQQSPEGKKKTSRTPTLEQKAQKFFVNHPIIREGSLGAFSGIGVPETDHPTADTFKGLRDTITQPPNTVDEEMFVNNNPQGSTMGRTMLPAYRMVKGFLQQEYGFSKESWDSIDWSQWRMPNPILHDFGSILHGMVKEDKGPQLAHGLTGMATSIVTLIKGGGKAPEAASTAASAASAAASTAASAAEKAVKGVKEVASGIPGAVTDTVQRAAGTGTHLADKVASQAKEATVAENVKIGERNTTATEKHATATEKVTDHNAAAEETYRTKVERINEDFGQKVEKVKQDHAGDVNTRNQKITELQQKHIADIKQARKEWVEKAHASKTAKAAKESVTNRKEVLERSQRSYVDRIKDNVAQTYSTVKGKLDARYEQQRQRPAAVIDEATGETRELPVKDIPLDSTKLKESLDQGRKTLQGAPADLKVFNDLMRQMEQGDGSLIDSPDGAEATLRPLTWDEGRTHFSALGDRLYSGELPGNVAKAIKQVRNALDGELESAAVKAVTEKDGQAAGSAMKKEYGQLKKDWSTFEDDWRDVGSEAKGASPLARLRLAVDRPAIAGQVMGKFGDRLIETLSKYKESGANPKLFDEARKISKEKTSGSVRVSHFPGNVESVPARVSVPKAPGKLELPEAPKEPAPIPSAEPRLAEIEADRAKKLERTAQDKPEPKPLPTAPVPEAPKNIPTADELVADLKEAKSRKAKDFAAEQSRPTKHDAIMIAIATSGAAAAGHLGYAAVYLPIRYGWGKFLNSKVGMQVMTRITPADIRTMSEVLDKMPEEKPAAGQAITGWLTDQIKNGRPHPSIQTFNGLLSKAELGSLLRLVAPPQPQPSKQQPQSVQQP